VTVLWLRQCLAYGRDSTSADPHRRLFRQPHLWLLLWELKAEAPTSILPRPIRIQEIMRRVPVDSSSVASIGYAPEQRMLELEFRQSGEVYQYFDVPAEEHAAFLAADSKGTYVNLHFKPRQYRYHRVWPQQE
jgi:KTSC domain